MRKKIRRHKKKLWGRVTFFSTLYKFSSTREKLLALVKKVRRPIESLGEKSRARIDRSWPGRDLGRALRGTFARPVARIGQLVARIGQDRPDRRPDRPDRRPRLRDRKSAPLCQFWADGSTQENAKKARNTEKARTRSKSSRLLAFLADCLLF